MKAKYEKPKLSVVDFEINTAISACTTIDGIFNDNNDCEHPDDMFPGNLFLEGNENCKDHQVKPYCKHTSMTTNFDS